MESRLKSSFSYAKNAKNVPHILAVLSNIQDLIDVSMFVFCHIVIFSARKNFSRNANKRIDYFSIILQLIMHKIICNISQKYCMKSLLNGSIASTGERDQDYLLLPLFADLISVCAIYLSIYCKKLWVVVIDLLC